MLNNTGNSVLALLFGAAIGAVVGILFAPDEGSKTREKIKDGFDDVKDNLKHKFEDVTDQLRKKFEGSICCSLKFRQYFKIGLKTLN